MVEIVEPDLQRTGNNPVPLIGPVPVCESLDIWKKVELIAKTDGLKN